MLDGKLSRIWSFNFNIKWTMVVARIIIRAMD